MGHTIEADSVRRSCGLGRDEEHGRKSSLARPRIPTYFLIDRAATVRVVFEPTSSSTLRYLPSPVLMRYATYAPRHRDPPPPTRQNMFPRGYRNAMKYEININRLKIVHCSTIYIYELYQNRYQIVSKNIIDNAIVHIRSSRNFCLHPARGWSSTLHLTAFIHVMKSPYPLNFVYEYICLNVLFSK